AMTGAERVRRFRIKHGTDKPAAAKSGAAAEIAALKQRIAELEGRGRSQGQLKVTHSRRQEFGEIGKLRAEIGKLKSDIIKLKMMLQEEPNAAKLRKKIVDQQVEMASMRQAMRRVAKERDKYQARVQAYAKPKHREARRLLTRENYNAIIKVMHSDRAKHVTPAELAEAERVAVALRPLFDEN